MRRLGTTEVHSMIAEGAYKKWSIQSLKPNPETVLFVIFKRKEE
jgi:hypothetical protein